MLRIAIAGWKEAGKSSFCQSFAHDARKKGTRALIANWDASAKRITYDAAFDIRRHVNWKDALAACGGDPRKTHVLAYAQVQHDEALRKEFLSLDADLTLIDAGGGLDVLASPVHEFFSEYVDALLWLEDRASVHLPDDGVRMASACNLLRACVQVPVGMGVSKCDGKTFMERPRTLSSFHAQSSSGTLQPNMQPRPFMLSAISRRGFDEVHEWITQLRT